jgi:hypothetical protein
MRLEQLRTEPAPRNPTSIDMTNTISLLAKSSVSHALEGEMSVKQPKSWARGD